MRWFIIQLAEDPLPAFIVAECIDEDWAKDSLTLIGRGAVLSEEEIGLDPDLAPALDRWNRRDESAYEAFLACEAAEFAIGDASIQLAIEERQQDGDFAQDTQELDHLHELASEREEERQEELRRWTDHYAVPEVGAYYWVSMEPFQRLGTVSKLRGGAEAASIARAVARDLSSYSRRMTGARPL